MWRYFDDDFSGELELGDFLYICRSLLNLPKEEVTDAEVVCVCMCGCDSRE